MDIHYNAFISYRHHPDDIRVASEIHRSLEHYKVPRAIRKKSKGITRLFRDKEELPITSDLTTDITRALENSDYLIVICSTHTKESTWVQREIETFLKTHDRNKVLTVLVNGEPFETIPEILLSEEREDPVTGEKVRIPIEPLSCDWRMPHRKAKREELPRLAAALLNVGYNELRQRERQYRTRRMIAAFSTALAISLCFMGYFIYSNAQIQEANERLQEANIQIQDNLDQALENQSLFLANASSELLDDGDRLTAIALALEALPEYEGERPYVYEAEAALAEAVGAYLVDGEIKAVGAFECGTVVSEFQVTDDGSLIYILDERNNLSVWDTDTCLQMSMQTLPLEYNSIEMLATASGNMIVYSSWDYKVLCCTPEGTVIWSDDCSYDMAFLEDDQVLMLISRELQTEDFSYLTSIRFLDPDTGEAVREPLMISGIEDLDYARFAMDSYPAVQNILLKLTVDYHTAAGVLDLNSGKITLLETFGENSSITCAGYSAEGNMILSVIDDAYSSNMGYFLDMRTSSATTYRLLCYTPSGRCLWETEITSYIYGFSDVIQVIPGSSNVFCMINNAMCVLDGSTGEILSQCETGSSPLYVTLDEDSAFVFLRDGSTGSYYFEKNICNVFKCTKDEIVQGVVNGGIFAHQNLSTKVVVYRYIQDENFESFTGDYGEISIKKKFLHGNLLAIEDYTAIYVFDTETRQLLWRDGEDYSFDTEILGFSEDGSTLWCIYQDDTIVAYDALTGASTQYPLQERLNDGGLSYQCQHSMIGTKIFCSARVYTPEDGLQLVCWDTVTHECSSQEIVWAEELDYSVRVVPIAGNEDCVMIWDNYSQVVYKLDLDTKELIVIASDVSSRPAIAIWDESSYLLGIGKEIQLRTFDGEILTRIDLTEKMAVSFCAVGDEFLALCDDGNVYRYSRSGAFLSSTGPYIFTSFQDNITANDFDPTQITWAFTDSGSLMLNVFSYGNLIDTSKWMIRATIPNLIAMDPVQELVIVNSSDSDLEDIAAGHLYTSEEISQMAREALNGYELTEDQKAAYGLLED